MKHILFSAWPDHQTPESAGPLLRLVAEVEESPETAANTGPIVVHCRYVASPSTAARGQAPFHGVSPGKGSKQSSRAGPVLTGTGASRSSSQRSVLLPSFVQNLVFWAGHPGTVQRGEERSGSSQAAGGGNKRGPCCQGTHSFIQQTFTGNLLLSGMVFDAKETGFWPDGYRVWWDRQQITQLNTQWMRAVTGCVHSTEPSHPTRLWPEAAFQE